MTLITASSAVAAITPVLISGPSPYAACSSNDNNLTGRTYLNAEVEPQVAVHGSAAIATFHQDRKSNGGAHGIGAAYSTNGGAGWTELASTGLPLTACSPNAQPALSNMWRASDPWVSFGPDGIAYFSALSFNLSVPNNANAVVAARSTDGGATWDHVQPIPGGIFQTADKSTDKNATTADPTKNKTAYTVWDTLFEPTDNPDDNPHAAAYTGPAYFSKTTDGGKTWSQAQVIIDTGNRQQTIGNIIVVGPDGTLYDFTDILLPPNTPRQGTRSNAVLAFVKSTDGGDTWTQPQVIAPFNSLGVINPNNPAQRARVGDGIEEVAVDPRSGQLYVVYESSSTFQKQLKQSSGAWDDEIMFTTSTDGGGTWSTPTAIHTANGLPTFTPTIAVNNGRVAVTYYDNRNLTPTDTRWPTDYFVEYSSDGGATWGNEQRITSASFDLTTAPVARGFFLGDYEGLQPSGSGFLAVYVKTNCDAPYPASNPLCAPASSNTAPTSNNNPNDVFSASLP